MSALDDVRADARASLERPGPLAGAESRVPGQPGLYAIYGDATTWADLGLGTRRIVDRSISARPRTVW